MISNLPTSVEDTHGKIYPLAPLNGHQGGQGIMYAFDKVAIKLLFATENGSNERAISTDMKQYARYQRSLIHLMAMPRIPHLSMPIAALKAPYCGYVMQFMSDMTPLTNLLKACTREEGGYAASLKKNGGLKKRLYILRNLASILRDIHNHGLVYCDLTPSNIFVSEIPAQYETWLIDIDNLTYGNEVTSNWQTPWYRAPEIYRGQSKNSSAADCYSFALVAYEVLTFAKPFHGEQFRNIEEDAGWDGDDAWDTASSQEQESIAQRKAESGELDYVGEKGTHNRKPSGIPIQYVASEEMQRLFLRTFGKEGRSNPSSRPTMNEWWQVLDAACQLIVSCANGHWHFGKNCLACALTKESDPTSRYFKVMIKQINYYADSVHALDEDAMINSIHAEAFPANEMVIECHYSKQKRNNMVSAEIPWKAFANSAFGHSPDAIAFSMSYNISDNVMTYEKIYDSHLKLSLLEDRDQPTIRAIWLNRFEYELTLEEVE